MFEALREEQGRRLLTNVKVVATGCMEGCLAGPALLVVPDNVWYGGVTEADVPQLVEQHLVVGEPVEILRIGPRISAAISARNWAEATAQVCLQTRRSRTFTNLEPGARAGANLGGSGCSRQPITTTRWDRCGDLAGGWDGSLR